ncbi:MAG: type II toxin-antitoxin system VapB family antitoxin [Pseudonocardiaceae bacterium]
MLNIKDPDADRLARQLAEATGETITRAVTVAVRERLERIMGRRTGRGLADELDEIAVRCAALPVLDERPEDEILGYDDVGLPQQRSATARHTPR